jgi:co-chaperonin GroES (HSP10)
MFTVQNLNLSIPQRPRGLYVLVLPLAQARAGLLVDAEENREQPEKGIVIDVGPGAVGSTSGTFVPVETRVGELVCYGRYAGLKFAIRHRVGDQDLELPVLIVRDTEIMLSQPAETLDLVVHDGDPRKIHEAGLICEHCPRVGGEAGLDRLRAIGRGEDPDARPAIPA